MKGKSKIANKLLAALAAACLLVLALPRIAPCFCRGLESENDYFGLAAKHDCCQAPASESMSNSESDSCCCVQSSPPSPYVQIQKSKAPAGACDAGASPNSNSNNSHLRSQEPCSSESANAKLRTQLRFARFANAELKPSRLYILKCSLLN